MNQTVMDLRVENVRCFAGRHDFAIKPLTILVGENSSGKTTLLSALSVVCDSAAFPFRPRFNEPPYSLGSFDTIATNGGGQGRADEFSLGFRLPPQEEGPPAEVTATYRSEQGQPEFSTLILASEASSAALRRTTGPGEPQVAIDVRDEASSHGFILPWEGVLGGRLSDSIVSFLLANRVIWEQPGPGTSAPRKSDLEFLELLLKLLRVQAPRSQSLAPIRTKPRRTYDEVKEYAPEGEHVPFALVNLLSGNGSGGALTRALDKYGARSGLYRRLEVVRLGREPGNPFQIQVTGSGRPANLIDVGYGVSQALPVIVVCALAGPDTLLLMQQPEVHLHPRAQAEIGTFFVDQVFQHEKKLVVETHSDYIVDRVRQEIVRQSLDPNVVSILYFEKSGGETTVHPLRLDQQGNVLEAPPGYREFFLREEMNLLARSAARS